MACPGDHTELVVGIIGELGCEIGILLELIGQSELNRSAAHVMVRLNLDDISDRRQRRHQFYLIDPSPSRWLLNHQIKHFFDFFRAF